MSLRSGDQARAAQLASAMGRLRLPVSALLWSALLVALSIFVGWKSAGFTPT